MVVSGPADVSGESLFAQFRHWHDKVVPQRITREQLTAVPKSVRNVLLKSLQSLNLISEDGTPKQNLTRLVKSDGAKRQGALRDVLFAAYGFILDDNQDDDFHIMRATEEELLARFEAAGATGEHIYKAELLFLQLVKEAGIPVSPKIRSVRAIRTPGGRRPRSNPMNQQVSPSPALPPDLAVVPEAVSVTPTVAAPPLVVQPIATVPKDDPYQLIVGLVQRLPKDGKWTKARRDKWLNAVSSLLDYVVEIEESAEGVIKVTDPT